MLTMPEINCIKLMRNQKSLSINQISKALGINWRTAKKYADADQLPVEKKQKKSGMMYEEKWREIVSDWLWEDQKLKKKNRRTNKGIFLTLQKLGFEGSYRTVSYFIADWRNGREDIEEETKDRNYERLAHPPAEAQLDFGLMEAVKDGEYVDVNCLIMTLPFSNSAFAIPLPAENQECLLDGMKRIFKQLGGVPKTIRIDNMKTAVIKPRNRHEEAVFTDEFLQFSNHYGFEPQACNAYSGHEKGNVENKVGYIRYNFITPSPVIQNLEHLADLLEEYLIEDRKRSHHSKPMTLQELLDEEHQYLLALPKEDYPVFKEEKVKANKYGEITLDRVKIYIPKGYNFAQLSVVKYWNRFKVLSPNGEIMLEDYRPYMHKSRAIPWHSILKSWLGKPRVVNHSRFAEYLPGRIREYLSIPDFTIRKERLKWLIGLLVNHDMEEINDCFYELLEPSGSTETKSESHPYSIDWSKYDQLQSTTQTKGEVIQ